MNKPGTKIVLTAPESEMSHFKNNPFMAFSASFPTAMLPFNLFHKFLRTPMESHPDGKAIFAPYGLRKLEAALIANGFRESDIAVVHPAELDKFVGNETRAVGISSMDPLGIAYVSLTYSQLIGLRSEPNTRAEFRKLLGKKCLRASKAKIILGGAGAWQLENDSLRESFGIDCVVLGEVEKVATQVFSRALNGVELPTMVYGGQPRVEEISTIRHASIHGCVEISRGCGRNCQFCAATVRRRRFIPLPKIIEEVKVNAREGGRMIILSTEDLFLYDSKSNFIPNRRTVVDLCQKVADCKGVQHIQPAHISLAPVVVDPQMVAEVAEILLEKSWNKLAGKPFFTSETGIETGSKRLIRKHMTGKPLPYKPEDWPEIVQQAFGILNDHSGYPLATWIVGLPGEREEDVLASLELADDLKGTKGFFVPLLFVPLRECALKGEKAANSETISQLQWELFTACWKYNLNVWRRPWALRSIRSLLSKILVLWGGGFMYLLYYRYMPCADFLKKMILHASQVDLFTPVSGLT